MKNVVIASPIETQSGYGHHAREIVSNLIENSNWNIKLISLPWGHTPFSVNIPDEWKMKLISPQLNTRPDIWVQITVPNELQPIGSYNIGFTAGTEGDICPKEWIDNMNRFDVIVTPSQFTAEVFIRSAEQYNVEINFKLQVIHEYINDLYLDDKSCIEITELESIKESFCYLSVGHWLPGQLGQDRKDLSGMIYTFYDTFKDTKDDVALVLKTSAGNNSIIDSDEIKSRIRQIKSMFSKYTLPNVYLIHGELSDEQMKGLYHDSKIKAFVTFTKAEGFGRPILEFASTGKPIMVPYYSGPADFLNREFICELPGQLTPIHPSAQNQWLINSAKWFTVDYKYASKMFKEVKRNYKKWKVAGKRLRRHAIDKFNSTAIKQSYITLIEDVDKQTPDQTELILPNTPKLELPKKLK